MSWSPPYQGTIDFGPVDFFTSSHWKSEPSRAAAIGGGDVTHPTQDRIAQAATGEVGHVFLYGYNSSALDWSVQTATGSRLDVVGSIFTAPRAGALHVQVGAQVNDNQMQISGAGGVFTTTNSQDEADISVLLIDIASNQTFGPFKLGQLSTIFGMIVQPGLVAGDLIQVSANQRLWVLAGLNTAFTVSTNVGSLTAQLRVRAHIQSIDVRVV